MTRLHSPDPGMPEDTFTLAAGGYVSVALPQALSRAEYEELAAWLELMRKKAERKIEDQDGHANTAGACRPEVSSEDSDSLSWE